MVGVQVFHLDYDGIAHLRDALKQSTSLSVPVSKATSSDELEAKVISQATAAAQDLDNETKAMKEMVIQAIDPAMGPSTAPAPASRPAAMSTGAPSRR